MAITLGSISIEKKLRLDYLKFAVWILRCVLSLTYIFSISIHQKHPYLKAMTSHVMIYDNRP